MKKTNGIMLLMLIFQYYLVPVSFGQENASNVEKTQSIHTGLTQTDQIRRLILDESIPFEQILPRVKKIESLLNAETQLSIEVMQSLVDTLSIRCTIFDDDNAVTLSEELISRYAFLESGENLSIFQKSEILRYQLCMILEQHCLFYEKNESRNDCVPAKRKKSSERLVELSRRGR